MDKFPDPVVTRVFRGMVSEYHSRRWYQAVGGLRAGEGWKYRGRG
jgi:hypothetical protein